MDNETAESPLQNSINVTGNTFEDIQIAIDNAQENDTIQLSGVYKSSGKQITVNKNVIIQGTSNTTLDAQSKSRIFIITSNNVTFSNLNFINAKTTTCGGAILSNGEVKIFNSTFKNNVINAPDTWDFSISTKIANGGAVYAEALTIDNSKFIGNSVTCREMYDEDFVFGINVAEGGAIYTTYLTLTNCVFNNNRAGHGCAVSIGGKGKIINCSFDNNRVNEVSTIYSFGNGTIISNSNFKNNAIVIEAFSNLTVDGCNFIDNSGTAIVFDSYDDKDFLNVSNCNFSNNKGESGGGIYTSVPTSVINSTFKNNRAEYGGAIRSYDKLYVSNCKFSDNVVTLDGGAVKCRDANIYSSVFSNNKVDSHYPSHGGGAIYADGVCNIYDSNFTKNRAALGGGIFTEKFSASATKLSLTDCKFADNIEGAVVSTGPKIIVKNKDSSKSFSGKKALDNNLKAITLIKSEIAKLSSTTYMSGDKLVVTVKYNDGKPVKRFQLKLKAVKGKTKKYLYADTNSKGIARFKISTLPTGSYGIEVGSDDIFPCAKSTSKIKINKAKTIVKAKKVTNRFKKSKYFKVSVKNKASKKPAKRVKVKLKVFTGNKYDVHVVKTNSKGIAKFNTKKLTRGKHKVLISSKDTNYRISAKSRIIIK